jgi:hypothetical protein
MSNTTAPVAQNQKNVTLVDNHKKAAKHAEESAKHHSEAAKHYEAGNTEKAAQSAINAHSHHTVAGEAQRENSKQHATAPSKK